MIIRCSECEKELVEETKEGDWLELVHFLGFLHSEEMITEATYMTMIERLMTFKAYAMGWDKPQKKEKK